MAAQVHALLAALHEAPASASASASYRRGESTRFRARPSTEPQECFFGAILAEVFLSSVKVHCEDVVDQAGQVLVRMFRDERKPTSRTSSQTSTRSTVLRLLDTQSATQIANGVVVNGKGISSAYVLNGADETCQAFRNGTPAMSVIARYFPGARLNLITPMNGFVRLVISRCPLNSIGASFLSGAMVNYLLANEPLPDIEPPTAWIYSATGTRYTNGTAEVRANWVGSDRGSGVKAYAVWMWRDGHWYQLTSSTPSTGWKITLRPGYAVPVGGKGDRPEGQRQPLVVQRGLQRVAAEDEFLEERPVGSASRHMTLRTRVGERPDAPALPMSLGVRRDDAMVADRRAI